MIINTSFLNSNLLRKYPLAEDATVTSLESWNLPDSLIVDLTLSVPISQFEPGQFFIGSITYTGDLLLIMVSYQPAAPAESFDVAQCSLDTSAHNLFDSYPLTGLPGFEYVTGRMTIGDTTVFEKLSVGLETFTVDGSRLSISAIRPTLGSVTSVIVDGQKLVGDINLVAGPGVTLIPNQGAGTLTIQVDPNSIDLAACGCADRGSPLMSINGLRPDASGNINITGANCLEIVKNTETNELILRDKCSAPCCDSQGFNTVVNNLDTITPLVTELNTYISQLKARMDNVINYVYNR